MKFEYTEDQRTIRQMIKEFMEQEAAPFVDEWEKKIYFQKK